MRLKIFLALGFALCLIGCPEPVPGNGDNPEPGTCEPECAWWQSCVNDECVTAEGLCARDEDCPGSHPVCHMTERVCVENGDPCALCTEIEECDEDGECVLMPGRCRSSDDCPPEAPACNTSTGTCVVASAPHSISSWPAAIVTSNSLSAAYEKLASIHTLTGTPTKVVTVEEICAGSCSSTDTRSDAPAAIKAWIASQEGLRYVLLGGGILEVPSRWVRATYSNSTAGVSFDETFVSDFYFSDLSEWDKSGNGVYAEQADLPAAGETGVLNYAADIGVARLPFSTMAEVERYTDKVLSYFMDRDLLRVRDALLLSNVATTIDLGLSTLEIDGGRYFDQPGRTIDRFPADTRLTKLYALGPTDESPDAVALTVPLQRQEMQAGHNLIVHAGHGDIDLLTTEEFGGNEFTSADALALQNDQHPIMLSCACMAADFASSDAPTAAMNLMNAPNGGAIGYMGNTTWGLGLGGGSQLIDEFLSCSFSASNPRVGDCLVEAHNGFTYPDEMEFPFVGSVTVVDRSSWEWTKKSVVYFGDPMIPVVSDPSTAPAPAIAVTRSALGDVSELVFTVSPAVAGTLMVEAAGSHYRVDVGAGEQATLTVPGTPSRVRAGFVAAGAMPSWTEQAF